MIVIRNYRSHNTNANVASTARKGCILIAAVFAISLSSGQADCSQWDVSGKWNMQHSHNLTELDLSQSGTNITGKAKLSGAIGTVKGTVLGADLELEISYGKTSVTRFYRGKVGPIRIDGIEFNQAETTQDTWHSTRAMRCGEATAPPPATSPPTTPAPFPPINTSGPMPGKTTHPAAPTISAHPKSVTIPDGQSQGAVTLTWDGGPDHPYAELWVKAGRRDETFVVEQGKGTRRVTVERGKTYLFILTDSGRRLATVVVTAK